MLQSVNQAWVVVVRYCEASGLYRGLGGLGPGKVDGHRTT